MAWGENTLRLEFNDTPVPLMTRSSFDECNKPGSSHETSETQLAEAKHLAKQGDIEEAEKIYRDLISLGTKEAVAYNNLGVICGLTGRLKERLELFRRALSLDPLHPEAVKNIGIAYLEAGRLEDAIGFYRHQTSIDSLNFELHLHLGKLLIQAGRADEAIEYFLMAVASEPDNSQAIAWNGYALQAIGAHQQAIELYTLALKLEPENIRILNLIGICNKMLGKVDEAIKSFQEALLICESDFEVLGNLASAYRISGQMTRAIECYDDLLQQQPSLRLANFGQLFTYSTCSGEYALKSLNLASRYWSLMRESEASTEEPDITSLPAVPLEAQSSQKIRIGILSAEIGDHVVGRFLAPFLEFHDRSKFSVELLSTSRRYEAVTEKLISWAEKHVSLQGLSAESARSRIIERGYQLILETSGFTSNTCIDFLARRCAPIQCHYIGYHATTGLGTIDYFIGDEDTVPEQFAWQFSERLWRLPRPWLAYSSHNPFPTANSIALTNKPVLGSFNQLSKVREETLRFWGSAMQRVPESVLLIKDKLTINESIRERIVSTLAKLGVAVERIVFVPPASDWQEHLRCYNAIDVALDATPWSSSTTAFEALGMGTPLVAIRGDCTSARMSSSIVRGAGRAEWITENPEEFSAVVEGLCSDLHLLRGSKKDFQNHVLKGPLFDGRDLTFHLQQAFQKMAWQYTTC